MRDQHYRRCFQCNHIQHCIDRVIPEVTCRNCGSNDTRAMKNVPPLWSVEGGQVRGVYVPAKVAVCPDCGEELIAQSLAWTSEGRPVASDIEIDCLSSVRDGQHEATHRNRQSDWQPVRDAVAKWCDAFVITGGVK